ncbi:MAG: prolipoprotein diacylglyceryl transferase, partial [Acidimicrobiia bacterium]|nr:prolipoprotein diacylglyceryl transferase [Acidimicrobiia bacterium]
MKRCDFVIDLLASIPSPSSNQLGPFRMYGLMIALGVLAAVELGRKRWRARGGDPDDLYVIAFWAVPAGLIGAR